MTNSNSDVILITGGTGFAGSHLVDHLLATGCSNIHVTNYGNNSGHVGGVLPQDQIHSLDLTDFDKTQELFESVKPTQVYQLAAIAAVGSSFNQLSKVINANTEIQLSVLTAVKETCPKARILSIGSALEYRPQKTALKETDALGPVSPYGVSKVAQEMLAHSFHHQHRLDIVSTRSFNHFGERQAPGFVVADFCLQVANLVADDTVENEIKVGNLSASRDFTYVKDIVKAYSLLMNQGKTGEVYNVGSGHSYTIQEILDQLISFTNSEIKVEIDESKFRPVDVPEVLADISKIKRLDWSPKVELDHALKSTFQYYQQTAQK